MPMAPMDSGSSIAVAHEGPHFAAGGFRQFAVGQILHEARLIDGLDRPETHRIPWELPEIRHQPGGDRGQAVAIHLLAEVVQLLLGEPAEQEGGHTCPAPNGPV